MGKFSEPLRKYRIEQTDIKHKMNIFDSAADQLDWLSQEWQDHTDRIEALEAEVKRQVNHGWDLTEKHTALREIAKSADSSDAKVFELKYKILTLLGKEK